MKNKITPGSAFDLKNFKGQLFDLMNVGMASVRAGRENAKKARKENGGWGNGTIPGLGLSDPKKAAQIKKPSQI